MLLDMCKPQQRILFYPNGFFAPDYTQIQRSMNEKEIIRIGSIPRMVRLNSCEGVQVAAGIKGSIKSKEKSAEAVKASESKV